MDMSSLTYSDVYGDLLNENQDHPTLSLATEDLKYRLASITDLEIGDEGWWDKIKAVLIGIGNVLGHILNLFKTNIFKFYKELKRTEIVYYNESNMVTMSLLFKIPYNEIVNFDMPFPNGLTTTYLDALDKTKRAVAAMDILTKSKSALVNAKKILEGLNKKVVMRDIITNSIHALDITDAKALCDLATKAVDENKNTTKEKRTFKQLFLSMTDLKKCNDLAISFTEYVDQVHPAYKNMSMLSDIFNQIVKYISRNPGAVDKSDIDDLGTLAYTIGETFDMFASLLFIFHKLEHNLVEVYKEIERNRPIGYRSTVVEDVVLPIANILNEQDLPI